MRQLIASVLRAIGTWVYRWFFDEPLPVVGKRSLVDELVDGTGARPKEPPAKPVKSRTYPANKKTSRKKAAPRKAKRKQSR